MTATNLLLRVPASVKKYLPLGLALLVLVVGLSWYVWPRMAAAFQAGRDVEPLERRAASLRAALADAGMTKAGDSRAGVAAFERLVAKEDRVPELMEIVARLALEPADSARARGLVLDGGQSSHPDGATDTTRMPVASTESLDPRWALFPGSVQYTPISVTVESTYDRVGQLLWRLRDLPTAVEVRSLEITRALPLLKLKMTLFALRRSDRPAPGAPATTSQPGPRVALNLAPGLMVLPWR